MYTPNHNIPLGSCHSFLSTFNISHNKISQIRRKFSNTLPMSPNKFVFYRFFSISGIFSYENIKISHPNTNIMITNYYMSVIFFLVS